MALIVKGEATTSPLHNGAYLYVNPSISFVDLTDSKLVFNFRALAY